MLKVVSSREKKKVQTGVHSVLKTNELVRVRDVKV